MQYKKTFSKFGLLSFFLGCAIKPLILAGICVGFCHAAEEKFSQEAADQLNDHLVRNADLFISNKLQLAEFKTFNNSNAALDVSPEKAGRKTIDNFPTSYGSYDKDITSNKAMKVVVRKVGTLPYCGLEFFWQIRDEENKATVLERSEPVLLFGDKRQAEFSRSAQRSDTRYVMLGVQEKDGEKITGWLARCVSLFDGTVIAVKASSKDLEALGKKGTALGLAN
jgi:hypothetical protein